eukprot:4863393-Prymnesium_polylepis.1
MIDKKSPKPARVSSADTVPIPAQSWVPPVMLMYFLSVECSADRLSSPRRREPACQRKALASCIADHPKKREAQHRVIWSLHEVVALVSRHNGKTTRRPILAKISREMDLCSTFGLGDSIDPTLVPRLRVLEQRLAGLLTCLEVSEDGQMVGHQPVKVTS